MGYDPAGTPSGMVPTRIGMTVSAVGSAPPEHNDAKLYAEVPYASAIAFWR
jgi:hypothetical protein